MVLTSTSARFACTVPIYCFMPDHLHLLLRGMGDEADAWAAMASFKQRTGFWIASNRPAFWWQKDYWDHIVRPHEDVRGLLRYIAENPVRRGLVAQWRDYPFTGSIGYELSALVDGVGSVAW